MSNPLFDKDFLKQLDLYNQKELHVRLTALNYDLHPLEYIEGQVTGGSVNVDGASALRRSCSLSVVADKNTPITEYYWAFDRMFKVEIGLRNYINDNYDDIIWFNQGVYIVNSFSKSESATSYNISISGQDKMCRLNGTISGNIPMEIDLANIDDVLEDGSIRTSKVLLLDIIRSVVHQYGQEPISNILINDLDMMGMELWEYRGNTPMYMFYQPASGNSTYGSILGISFDGEQKVDKWAGGKIALKSIPHYYIMNTLNDDFQLETLTAVKCNGHKAYVIKLEYGAKAGYHQTDLTFAGDLIAKAGETVSSILDKITKMLGNFEYFYDLNGRFIFQKKKTYINELFSPINGDIVEPMMTMSPYSYEFEDNSMFTSIQISPNVANVKNDFVIWGTKTSVSGGTMPIHVRYAIDKKPYYYCTYDGTRAFVTEKVNNGIAKDQQIVVDWREIIYRMAIDYNRYHWYEDFYLTLQENNKIKGQSLYPEGITGYQQYYVDIAGFWRLLYQDPDNEEDAEGFYPHNHKTRPNWNKNIDENPEGFLFWFDFLDVGEAPLARYSVPSITSRSKVENVSGNSNICYISTPEVLYILPGETVKRDENTTAYTSVWLPNSHKKLFSMGSQGTSLISKANELIYQYACCAEGVNLTAIPIFYLEPNTRIRVEGIGDLIVTKIGYNLAYGGTMSLTCTKVIPSIY